MKVFWSWQSDTPGKTGRHFVRDALQAAIVQLQKATEVSEPSERDARAAIHLDQDRKGVTGSPDLAPLIFEKIEQSAVFIADVTATGVISNDDGEIGVKKLINSNVAIELGYALHAVSDRKILMVMNEHYGSRADLPFDLRSKAGPILFALPPNANRETLTAVSKQLTAKFVEALEPFILHHVDAVRREELFPQADEMGGPGRFRAPGEPIGKLWQQFSIGANPDKAIFLAGGGGMWLRLMPTHDSGRRLTSRELRDKGLSSECGVLQPLFWSSHHTIRAEDGIGFCNLVTPGDDETNSVVFAFETGEVWAIDSWLLALHPNDIFIVEIERMFTERLQGYACFLKSLGLNPPYRWIAGVTNVKHRQLHIPLPAGRMRIVGWRGPECLAEQIVVEGSYDGQQAAAKCLAPFFKAIYHKCGESRPD